MSLVPFGNSKEFSVFHGIDDNSKKIKKKRKRKPKTYEVILKKARTINEIQKNIDESEKIPQQLKRSLKKIELNPLMLIVSNMPPSITSEELQEFFNTLLRSMNSEYEHKDINPVRNATIGFTNKYAVLEFLESEPLWKTLKLDGVELKELRLKIQRPKGFFVNHFKRGDYQIDEAGNVFNNIDDDEVRLYMGNIPQYMNDDQVKSLIESFGALRDFQMKMETSQGENISKGYCFFEYFDSRNAEKALLKLNGLEIGQKTLKVSKVEQTEVKNKVMANRTAPTKEVQTSFLLMFPKLRDPLIQSILRIPTQCVTPSKVIQLLNMMMIEDLFEEEFIRDLHKDVESACQAFGSIEDIVIPRPDHKNGICSPSVGKVFIKFFYLIPAKQARFKLNGRTYNKRTVIASFYPEEKFDKKEYLIKG